MQYNFSHKVRPHYNLECCQNSTCRQRRCNWIANTRSFRHKILYSHYPRCLQYSTFSPASARAIRISQSACMPRSTTSWCACECTKNCCLIADGEHVLDDGEKLSQDTHNYVRCRHKVLKKCSRQWFRATVLQKDWKNVARCQYPPLC